ncbi:hypothetical protein SNEBB_008045 [Seison nebaliae]|nr:hypothetical protein SNEBB_008045 [Seison nebaliae]
MCPPQHFSYSTYATKCKLIDCNKSPCYVQIQKNGNRQEHCNCFWTRSGTYCQRLSSSVIILFVLSIVVIISVLAFSAFFTYRRSKKRRREIDRIVTSPYRIKKSLQMKNSLNGKKEESRKETEKNLKSSTSLISIVSEYMNEVNMEERLKKKSKKERTNIHQLYLPPRKTLPAIFMRDDGMTHSYHDIESI